MLRNRDTVRPPVTFRPRELEELDAPELPPGVFERRIALAEAHEREWRGRPEAVIRAEMERALERRRLRRRVA
jgi:hypothetical protein